MTVKSLLVALSAALAVTLFGAEPQSAEARPITCPVSATSTLPLKSEYPGLVAALGEVGNWNIYAPISSRCQSQLGKGHYLYRAEWTVRLQLISGWPIGIDYTESDSNSSDAFIQSGETSFFSIPNHSFSQPPWEAFEGSYLITQSTSGVNESTLTDLCVGEQCVFQISRTGHFASVRDDAIPAIYTLISTCFEYSPRGPEGEAETEDCDGTGQRHAHPGTFGMQVRVSGTMNFEPLWTWRR